jgi:hypothetical protein
MKMPSSLSVTGAFRHRFLTPDPILFWAVTAATGLLVLTLGFFLHRGVMGLYMDDYSIKAWAFDFVKSKWNLTLVPFYSFWTWRPLTYLLVPNLANAIPQHAFWVRVGIVVIHILNVCLLGRLGQRLSGSLLVGIVCGGYFLFPVFANEGLLWFTAAIQDTFCLLFLLVGFHLFLSCRSFADLPLLVCGVISWLLMVTFYESGLFTVLLLPVLFGVTQNDVRRTSHKLWVSALAASSIPISLYLWFGVRRSPFVIARGGATLDLGFILSHKVPDVARGFWWLLTDWGLSGPLHEAFKFGWREWRSAPGGPTLMATSFVGICLVTLLFPADRDEDPPASRLINLFLIGVGWMVLGLVPIVLVRSQSVDIRTLYVPSAGFALSAAALSGLVVNLFGKRSTSPIRVVLAFMGVVVFLTSLTMAGLVRAYQLRWYLDERQVEAMGPVVSQLSRAEPLWLLAVALDERSVSNYWGRETVLDHYLFGVFEHSWSASDAIRLRFGNREIHAVTSQHWDTLHVTAVRSSGGGHITEIVFQGEAIPIEHLVAFTFRQGELILIDPIEINDPNHDLSAVIDLPLVPQLAGTGLKIEKVELQP